MVPANRRHFLSGVASIATLTTLAGCSGGGDDGSDGEDGGDTDDGGSEDGGSDDNGSSTPEPETVLVGPETENVFDPASLEIQTGTEVTFVWESSGHSLIVDSQPDGADWSGVSETQDQGYEHTHVFDVAGTYEYYCDPHRTFGMEGTVTVTEG